MSKYKDDQDLVSPLEVLIVVGNFNNCRLVGIKFRREHHRLNDT